jgi:hypothetical protein
MALSEARKRATYKYIAKAYDRIVLNLPRGERDRIKAAAGESGESVNAYIKRAISAQMQREDKNARAEEDQSGEISD